jgi:hypothetical protein
MGRTTPHLALHAKLSVMYMGGRDTPAGMVAPYPEFFAGLASLAGRTADALDGAGLTEPFDPRAAAAEMASQIALYRQFQSRDSQAQRQSHEEWQVAMEKTAPFVQVLSEQREKQRRLDASQKAHDRTVADLEELAKRVAGQDRANEDEIQILKQFAAAAETKVPGLLREFATACERLEKLAAKTADGIPLTDDDSKWIRGYGAALAKFHFYDGNSYLTPLDNFPIVARVFVNPLVDHVLHAGLGRPQALYVIVPEGNKLRLYQGAVMTYREFTRAAGEPLDDESWRAIVFRGLAPPPPLFTRSFYAEADAKELIRMIRDTPRRKDFEGDYERDKQIEQAARLLLTRASTENLPDVFMLLRNIKPGDDDLAELLAETISRLATTNDVPKFIALLTTIQSRSHGWPDDIMPALARAIAKTPWEPHQLQLIRLLTHDQTEVAVAASQILASKPEALDVRTLSQDFGRQPPRTRRLYCKLLSRVIERPEARSTLLRAVQDSDDAVRWQAVSAMYAAKWNDSNSVAALVSRLGDSNHCVRFGAAFALGKLGAAEAAPVLLESLRASRQASELSDEEWDRQIAAVSTRDTDGSRWGREPDELPSFFANSRARNNLRQADTQTDILWILRPAGLRMGRLAGFTFEGAAVTALGELEYIPATEMLLERLGGENHDVAVQALRRLDPARLEQELFSMALNRQADARRRATAVNGILDLNAANRARDLAPLLDETEIIVAMPPRAGSDWRLCDHAAIVMAKLLDWETTPQSALDPAQREELIQKLRDWARDQR